MGKVSYLMSLNLNAVRQENRNARFKAGAEHGVEAKRITSSCERCSLSVEMVSMRSRKPFGFSFIFLPRKAGAASRGADCTERYLGIRLCRCHSACGLYPRSSGCCYGGCSRSDTNRCHQKAATSE